MVGIDLQRLIDEFFRSPGKVAAVARGQQVGIVGQQLGIGLDQRPGLVVGALGFLGPMQGLVGTRQHGPTLQIIRLLLQLGRQRGHHTIDVGASDVTAGHGIKPGRIAEQRVERNRGSRQGDREGDQRPARGSAPDQRSIRIAAVVDQTALDFAPGQFEIGLRQLSGGTVAIQFGQLIAVNGGVQCLSRRRCRVAPPPPWAGKQGQGDDKQGAAGKQE